MLQVDFASSAESRTPTLVAAALQDHLSRQYNLSLNPNAANSNVNVGRRHLKQRDPATRKPWASLRQGGAATRRSGDSKNAESASSSWRKDKTTKLDSAKKGTYMVNSFKRRFVFFFLRNH